MEKTFVILSICIMLSHGRPHYSIEESENDVGLLAHSSRGSTLMATLQRVLMSERSKRTHHNEMILNLIKREIGQRVDSVMKEEKVRSGPVSSRRRPRWAASRSATGSTTDRGGWGGGYGK